METQQYEHHLSLLRDKLCPFKIKTSRNVKNTVCNWHENIEILVVREGEGMIQYGAEEFAIAKGDVVVVNSGALHRPFSETGISFDYLIIDESFCLENGLETSSKSFEKRVRSEKLISLCRIAGERYDSYQSEPSPIGAARLRASVLEILITLFEDHILQRDSVSPLQKSSEEYVKKTIEYLTEHCTENVTLEAVAAECGVTKYHLAREFKRFTGQTVFTYLNVLRCKRAERCLSSGMTVTEAAYECGFESLSYFSRTYKKLMGVLPRSSRTARGAQL